MRTRLHAQLKANWQRVHGPHINHRVAAAAHTETTQISGHTRNPHIATRADESIHSLSHHAHDGAKCVVIYFFVTHRMIDTWQTYVVVAHICTHAHSGTTKKHTHTHIEAHRLSDATRSGSSTENKRMRAKRKRVHKTNVFEIDAAVALATQALTH